MALAIAITVLAYAFYSSPEYREPPKSPFWTEASPLPTPRTEVTGAAIDTNVYIVGGFDSTGRPISTVEVYDSSKNSWSAAALCHILCTMPLLRLLEENCMWSAVTLQMVLQATGC
jgi:hypothetical protein